MGKSRQSVGTTHGAESRVEELEFQFDDDDQELGGKKHDFSDPPWDPGR